MMERPADALTSYRAKRRFDKTAEPRGDKIYRDSHSLYIIQKHDARRLHYDIRLELDGVLVSWAVTRGPSYRTADKRLAVRTEDHPLEYGSFEGTIPKGNYGAGTVMLWDKGSWNPQGDPHEGLKKGKFTFVLNGERLKGRWALVRMRPREQKTSKKSDAKRENIKEHDEFANMNEKLLDDYVTSVKTQRTLDEIANAELANNTNNMQRPKFCEPSLATLVDEAPNGKEWLYEIKYDGYRAQISMNGRDVKIFKRTGLDWTNKFPQLAEAAAKLDLPAVLIDGEIVVLDAKGRSNFGALVDAIESGRSGLTYFAFDLLFSKGVDLRNFTLRQRKEALKLLLSKAPKKSPILFSEVFSGGEKHSGLSLLKTACAYGLEGLIVKRRDAPYRAGRSHAWLKIKCKHKQEFIILGFSSSKRGRAFSSLLLGLCEGNKLHYVGRVGTGFSEQVLKNLADDRDRLITKTPAAADIPTIMKRGTTWVKPELVANIAFSGWTDDNETRQGRYLGLREDKSPHSVVKETAMPAAKIETENSVIGGMRISHPDKIIYPDINLTKIELAQYIEAIAKQMMPFIKERFVTLVRCPSGAEQKCFFQRHFMQGFGELWLQKSFINKAGETEYYIYINNVEALIVAIQMGVLEFHIWGSRIDEIHKPDRIVFDLDPDPSIDFETVKRAAFRLRDILQALDLQSLPLISGGKGIHVVVPIQRDNDWPVVKEFAGLLSVKIEADAPQQFVVTMSKAKRKGKIFIDHFRNEIGATAIAPYSPRARKGAPVAWPVNWENLSRISAANEVSVPMALTLDLFGWKDYGNIKQKLSQAALRAVGVDVIH